jgi:hypothetical protein
MEVSPLNKLSLLNFFFLLIKNLTFITIHRSYYAYPETDDAELLKLDFKKTNNLFEVNV